MIKIHAGLYKNRTIKRVGRKTTKETASMVREAVFNSLFNINGKCLDLFAGSGSYGITALSLGASEVVFNDYNFHAFKTIKNNLKSLNINAKVLKLDYKMFFNKNEILFDYIFLDPPYNFNNYYELLDLSKNHLNKGGKIILEVDKKDNIKINSLPFDIIKEKSYGSKKIYILNLKLS